MIELTNGCICCTLRKDLLETLQELCQHHPLSTWKPAQDASSTSASTSTSASDGPRKLPRAILIESTGIAEPIHVAETFAYCEEVEQVQYRTTLQKRAPRGK